MEIAEALAFLDTCRFWSLSDKAVSCSWQARPPKSRAELGGWEPLVRSSARRKPGETLEGMLCRAVALAAERRAVGWKNPVFIGSGTNCAGCGRPNHLNCVRLERRLKLPLCPDCRRGVSETVSNR